MSVFKKILILLTILIMLYIIWQLIQIRFSLKKQMIENPKENFIGLDLFKSTKEKELSKVENTSKVNITNANKNSLQMPLKELCIKASLNSAISGSNVNLDMLQYVINRGVRYLDFEVFYINPDGSGNFVPVVASSTDPNFVSLDTENHILLDNVLSSAVSYGFSSPCPNYKDPLFINLRIKSNNKEVYNAVAISIDNSIKNKIYSDLNDNVYIDTALNTSVNKAKKVTKNTILNDIMGCVIISIDKTIYPNYLEYTKCDSNPTKPCYDLKNYINIQNGSNDMNLYLYSYLSPRLTYQINDDNKRTNVETINVAIPDNVYLMNSSNNNLDYADCILKYGCQIVPYRFYHYDDALEKYEEFFNMGNGAFVSLANAISYYNKHGKMESNLLT